MPHTTDDASALSIILLVVETNRSYPNYSDRLDERPLPIPDTTEAKTSVFLAVTIQMGHPLQDQMRNYWAKMNQLRTLT